MVSKSKYMTHLMHEDLLQARWVGKELLVQSHVRFDDLGGSARRDTKQLGHSFPSTVGAVPHAPVRAVAAVWIGPDERDGVNPILRLNDAFSSHADR